MTLFLITYFLFVFVLPLIAVTFVAFELVSAITKVFDK